MENGERPSWHHFRTDGRSIEVDVHPEAYTELLEAPPSAAKRFVELCDRDDALIVPSVDQEFFGYGPTFTTDKLKNGWINFHGELPVGTGGSATSDELFRFAMSLDYLVKRLHFSIAETDSEIPQLLTLNPSLFTPGTNHASPIEGIATSPLLYWMDNRPLHTLTEPIISTIAAAYEVMDGRPVQDGEIKFNGDDGYFWWISVPGNGIGLHTEDEEPEGTRLASDNCDTARQQTGIIFGLAKLEELAAEEYRQELPTTSE